jgi:hypothetical protein
MQDFDGKEVECLWYGCEADQIRARQGERLVFDYRYHGTYDDCWIVRLSADGEEVERHNINRLGGWTWKRSIDSGTKA